MSESDQNFVVVKQETIASKFGGYVVKITLVGTRDRQEYVSYIDPRNHNVKNWWQIINNPLRGYILGKVKVKTNKDGRLIVNADSDPIIRAEVEDAEDLFKELIATWREQDERVPNQYRTFFGE